MAAVGTTPPATNHRPAMDAVLNTYELAELLLLAISTDAIMYAAAALPALRNVIESSRAIRERLWHTFYNESPRGRFFFGSSRPLHRVFVGRDEYVELIAVITGDDAHKSIATVTNSKEFGLNITRPGGTTSTWDIWNTDEQHFRSQLQAVRSRRASAVVEDSVSRETTAEAVATA